MMTEYSDMAEQLLVALEQFSHTAPHRLLMEYSKGEVFLLGYLREQGGTARPGEMSAAMGASTARVAAAINSMQRKGWVLREVDPTDHRKALIHLRPEGIAYLDSCRKRIHSGITELMDTLGPEQAKEYLELVMGLVRLHNKAQLERKCKE